jgi:N-acetylglucosamine-6-phosphate deacetylase
VRRGAAAALLGLALAGCAGAERREGDLLIPADRVCDGRRVIEGGAVLVDGREIAYAGLADEVEADADRRIELGDATVLPGFIDLHVHGAL